MPYTPEGRAQVEAWQAEKRERARRGLPQWNDPRATLGMVEAGWPIESTERRYTGSDLPIGGVVVEVSPGYLDDDTGEITPTRYRILDPWRGGHEWNTLEAPEVNTHALKGVDRMAATGAVYWLLRQIPHTRKVLHPKDVAHLHDAWILGVAAARL